MEGAVGSVWCVVEAVPGMMPESVTWDVSYKLTLLERSPSEGFLFAFIQ